jgi:SAM-dependent methyltransferase
VRLDDPEVVRREYATEAGLQARASVYAGVYGPNAWDVAVDAVRETSPRRVLEVGCGWGEFVARLARELRPDDLVAVDLSPRMVELARERGVDTRVGDVQQLPFPDGAFDCAVANWMLYHVPDLDRALGELARVLRPGGRLVAATNGLRHLGELWDLVGRDRAAEPLRFFAETGEEALRPHFARVERRDATGTVRFATREHVQGYIASSIVHKHLADRVPPLEGPVTATRVAAIFVADKP